MKVRLHHRDGQVSQIAGIRRDRDGTLPTALDQARIGESDARVLWEQPRLGGVVRTVARVVFGVGWVAGVLLAIAAVFVGWPALVALVVVLVLGGSFVAVVWRRDVGITVHADGTLRRAGWSGISQWELGDYDRVSVG